MSSLYDIIFIYGAAFIVTAFFYVLRTRIEFLKGVNYLYCLIFIMFCGAYMGFRDFSVGTDTLRYVSNFQTINVEQDIVSALSFFGVDIGLAIYGYFIKLFSKDPSVYLFFIALLFLSLYTIANYRLLKRDKYLIILLIVSFFFFYQMGVNNLKTAIAISLCILSLSYDDYWKYICMAFAIVFHFTAFIFILSWILVRNVNNLRFYIIVWCSAVIVSFIGFGIIDIMSLAGGVYLDILRYGQLLMYVLQEQFSYQIGFRYDFLLFSVMFLIIPYFYLRHSKDPQYEFMLKLYLIMNALFILSFYIPYSNRVGLFSWALLPVLVGKPLIHGEQSQKFIFPLSAVIFIISCFVLFN